MYYPVKSKITHFALALDFLSLYSSFFTLEQGSQDEEDLQSYIDQRRTNRTDQTRLHRQEQCPKNQTRQYGEADPLMKRWVGLRGYRQGGQVRDGRLQTADGSRRYLTEGGQVERGYLTVLEQLNGGKSSRYLAEELLLELNQAKYNDAGGIPSEILENNRINDITSH